MSEKPRANLRVIDIERRRNIRLQNERRRLFPFALIGLSVFCILSFIFFILKKKGLISSGGVAGTSFVGIVNTLIVMGFIPLVTASVILLVVKPPTQLILGSARNRWSFLFAPILGILSAMAVWCIRELLVSWVATAAQYVAIPSYLYIGQTLLDRSFVISFLVFLATVLVPATALEFFLRGLVQPGLLEGAGPRLSSFQIAILLPLALFDTSGFVLIAFGSLISSWVRLSCDSLVASSLTSAGYNFSLLMSGRVYGIVGTTIFSSITMDDAQYRVFLITCLLFLSLLLIAPIAFIQGLDARLKQHEALRGHTMLASERSGARRFMTIILTLILVTALFAGAFLFST